MTSQPEDYAYLLTGLLPPGPAFNSGKNTLFSKMLLALGAEAARVHNRALALIEEADPRTTYELLDKWEAVAGLPDPCTVQAPGINERRARLLARITEQGGQSRAYFISLAAQYGFTITITEFFPFRAGMRAGSRCGDKWAYAWYVNSPATPVNRFTAGSTAGEPLASWGNAILECVIGRAAPAHTKPIFVYGS